MKNLLFIFFMFVLIFSSANAQGFITIDAQKDAFYDSLVNPNDGKIFIPARSFLPEDTSSSGKIGPPWGDADISGIVWTAWDSTYLYYYVEVKDNLLFDNKPQNWNNDKVELKYDPNPSLKLTGQGNSIQVGMTAYDSTDAQLPAAVDNLNLDQKIGTEMVDTAGNKWHSTPDDYARRETADGYVLEFRIPFKYLNKGTNKLRPVAVGMQFGSSINIVDNDSAGRQNTVNWSAGHKDAAWNTPKYDGAVTLLDGHKCKYEAKSLQVDSIVNPNEIDWYFGGTTSVKSSSITPASFKLMQNYPNPFNPTTTIEFSLLSSSDVRLELVNVLGQTVKVIARGNYTAGNHQVTLDASHLASGIYFYKLQAGSFADTKKLLLLK
jgi:Carbohydrate family 9 binding domain-like/Secretion system C-terminal sorting domain